jgi:hypothetical protein
MDHGMNIIRDIQFTLRTLRKNPASQSGRLVNVWESDEKPNLPKRRRARQLLRLAHHEHRLLGNRRLPAEQLQFAWAAEPDPFPGAICDPGVLAALGIAPMLGHTLNESENQPGQDGVVLLGYG